MPYVGVCVTTGDRFLIERHFWAIYHPDMAVQHAEVATMTSRNSCAKLVGRCHRSKIEDLVHARERLQQDSAPMDLEAIKCVRKPYRSIIDFRIVLTHTSLPFRTGLFEAQMELDINSSLTKLTISRRKLPNSRTGVVVALRSPPHWLQGTNSKLVPRQNMIGF